MEDWIQETCLISAVISEPKTFQEAWHYPVDLLEISGYSRSKEMALTEQD